MTGRALLLSLVPALLGGAVIAGGATEPPAAPLPPISSREWVPQPGDVVLTAADDLIGANIRRASGESAVFSHVGLVVLRNGAPAVIEATPFGSGKVAFADFDTFTRDPETTEMLVLRPRTRIDAGRLREEAERLAAIGIKFDYAFDMADASELYCAELVYHLLGTAGLDLGSLPWTQMYVPLHGERRLVVPDAFTHATELQPVFRRRFEQ